VAQYVIYGSNYDYYLVISWLGEMLWGCKPKHPD